MATGPLITEIDQADDLLLPVEEEFEEEVEEEAADERPTEQDESAIAVAEEVPERVDEDEEEDFEDEGAPRKKKKKKKKAAAGGPGVLALYGVPAAGAAMILSLGWTFAFIARSGLVPPAGEKVTELKTLAQIPGLEGPKSIQDLLDEREKTRKKETEKAIKETLKDIAKNPPKGSSRKAFKVAAEEVSVEGAMKMMASAQPQVKGRKLGDGFSVPFGHSFYIPLEGGRRKPRDNTVFLHFALSILVTNKATASEINAKRSVIRQRIFEHFNALSPSVLRSPKGRNRARRTLVARLSKELIQGKVERVLFKEFFTR